MANVRITSKELLMLDAMKKMREIVKSDAKKSHKETAVNEVFWRTMKAVDVIEGREEE